MTTLRVVLDTNCLVSALIFSHGKLGALRTAWQQGRILPLICRETVAELIRVLGYPKFRLDQHDIESLLGDFLPWTETVQVQVLPCIEALRDRDDAIFIHLARSAAVPYLVSGDRHLLELKQDFDDFQIISAAEMLEILVTR